MSEERTIDAGPRRLERLRERHGAPVRAAPCAIGAIAAGLAAAWAFGVPARLLGEVSEGLRAAGHAGLSGGGVDGAAEVRSVVGAVTAACWPVPAAALAGAWLGAVVQGRLVYQPEGKSDKVVPIKPAADRIETNDVGAKLRQSHAAEWRRNERRTFDHTQPTENTRHPLTL